MDAAATLQKQIGPVGPTLVQRDFDQHVPSGKKELPSSQEMSNEDWDQFERDVADAFERIP